VTPLLAVDAPTDAVPYAWVAIVVVALAGVVIYQQRLITAAWKREQDRADALARIVNAWVIDAHDKPGEE
jgi:hypothetical protein